MSQQKTPTCSHNLAAIRMKDETNLGERHKGRERESDLTISPARVTTKGVQ